MICLYNLNAVKYSILFAEKTNEGEASTLAVFFAYVGSELEWPRNIQNEKRLSLEKSKKLSEDTEEIPFVTSYLAGHAELSDQSEHSGGKT